MTTAIPQLGQIVYITSIQANVHIYAVVTDGSTPNLNSISMDVSADEASVIVPGLIGQTGPAGIPQFALTARQDVYASPAALEAAQTGLTEENFGDYWIIATYDDNDNPVSAAAYTWWGSYWRVIPFGTQGPTGPWPVITPQAELIPPGETSYVVNSGPISNPSWTFYLAAPAGIQGPTGSIAGCPDVTEIPPPTTGQVLGFGGSYEQGLPVWQPMTVGRDVAEALHCARIQLHLLHRDFHQPANDLHVPRPTEQLGVETFGVGTDTGVRCATRIVAAAHRCGSPVG